MAVDVSGHTAEGGVLPGDEILLPPRRHPPDQLQRRQHQVLAQLLEARLPLRCIPVHQAEELLQVRKLLRLVKQGAAVRGKQAVWRQVRQRQVPDGHAQGLIRLVCLGEFVVEGAAAAQHHISGCHLVPAEIDGVPAAALSGSAAPPPGARGSASVWRALPPPSHSGRCTPHRAGPEAGAPPPAV